MNGYNELTAVIPSHNIFWFHSNLHNQNCQFGGYGKKHLFKILWWEFVNCKRSNKKYFKILLDFTGIASIVYMKTFSKSTLQDMTWIVAKKRFRFGRWVCFSWQTFQHLENYKLLLLGDEKCQLCKVTEVFCMSFLSRISQTCSTLNPFVSGQIL